MSKTISPNTTIAQYTIVSKIGEGGMGEVYRARDTKLGRDVAIKVLPPSLSTTPDRLSRFEQEAQAAGALNHPNILSIYHIGTHNGAPYIVSELLEGETLRERLAGGALPQRKATDFAWQIAKGLAAAHEKGIVHRDIKPDNIFITNDGRVKILDFGLAKLAAFDPAQSQTAVPTRKVNTDPGTVMGTMGYMSPEQLKGNVVDQRSDIFSFGAILYEMLSGKHAFRGDSPAETISAILREDPPDISETNKTVSPALERVVRHCLEKNPAERFHSASDLGFAIGSLFSGVTDSEQTATVPSLLSPMTTRSWWANLKVLRISSVVLALTLLASSGFFLFRFLQERKPELPLRKLDLQVPGLDLRAGYDYSISPDGRSIAYVNDHKLWIRDLDRLEARQIPNSDNSGHPFWSPDSSYLGYVVGKKIWRASRVSGENTAIADLPDSFSPAGSAGWRSDGTIIFTTGFSGLLQVQASGGDVSHLLDAGTDEVDFHDLSLLPEGRGAIFAVHRSVHGIDTIGVFDGKTRKTLLQLDGQRLSNPVYSPTGHILFQRRLINPGIWALPFSIDRLEATGEPFLVVPGASAPRIADDGTLVFGYSESDAPTKLVWVNRLGNVVSDIQPEPLPFQMPGFRLSPDGNRLIQATRELGKTDFWVVDVTRGTRTRLTFDNRTRGWFCGWMPNGQQVLYSSSEANLESYKVMSKAADGGGSAIELLNALDAAVSPDGKTILYALAQENLDLWFIGTEQGAKPKPFMTGPKDERSPAFSPDGKYVAYMSDESGRYEVYVKPFPSGEGEQVSSGGGAIPIWSHRGDELFFAAGVDLMAVPVRTKPTLSIGQPKKLFARSLVQADRPEGLFDSYDVSADGQRFVLLQTVEEKTTTQKLTVIQNWFAQFKNKQ